MDRVLYPEIIFFIHVPEIGFKETDGFFRYSLIDGSVYTSTEPEIQYLRFFNHDGPGFFV
jgi:hypothetical protein